MPEVIDARTPFSFSWEYLRSTRRQEMLLRIHTVRAESWGIEDGVTRRWRKDILKKQDLKGTHWTEACSGWGSGRDLWGSEISLRITGYQGWCAQYWREALVFDSPVANGHGRSKDPGMCSVHSLALRPMRQSGMFFLGVIISSHSISVSLCLKVGKCLSFK